MGPRTPAPGLQTAPLAMRCFSIPKRRGISSSSAAVPSAATRPPSSVSSRHVPPAGPETRAGPAAVALSFLPPPSNDPRARAIPAPSPHPSVLQKSTTLFTTAPPRALYTVARFMDVPVNSHMPEVCLLGRSNVGKSTLLNALSGAQGKVAGTTHGIAAKRAGLAFTSTRAGCTKTLNAYGFGPPMKLAPTMLQDLKATKLEMAEGPIRGDGGRRSHSRAERRKRAKDTAERLPQQSLVIMDMPGYGLNSLAEWGTEITKYLAKRQALRGAVLLVDAVAGPKPQDLDVLALLRDLRLRTTVVLTKADKLGYGLGYSGATEEGLPGTAEAVGRIGQVCVSVWEELRKIESQGRNSGRDGRDLDWKEGVGWDREIWITGAGDAQSISQNASSMSIAGARLAICRLAGLVQDTRELGRTIAPGPPVFSGSDIISFEDLGLGQVGQVGGGEQPRGGSASSVRAPVRAPTPTFEDTKSVSFDELERLQRLQRSQTGGHGRQRSRGAKTPVATAW